MGLLRIILALNVVGAHLGHPSYLPFIPGDLAVAGFFIVSGFYMAYILETNLKYKKKSVFIGNRAARIFSAYWICFFIILAINLHKFDYISKINIGFGAKVLIIISNFFIFGSDLVLFSQSSNNIIGIEFTSNFRNSTPQLHEFLLLPQAWSLPLELTFYFIIIFIISKQRLLIILFIISILSRFLTYKQFGDIDPWTYRFFPNELALFIIGIFSCKIMQNYNLVISTKNRKLIKLLTSYTLVICIFYVYQHSLHFFPVAIQESKLIKSARPLLLIFLFFIFVPLIFQLSKWSKVDKFLGDLSFPIYLLHLGVIQVLQGLQHKTEIGYWTVSAVTLLLSILIYPLLNWIESKLRVSFSHIAISISSKINH